MKIYFIALLIILFILPISLLAQESIDFSGYIVDLPYFQKTNDVISKLLNSDKEQFLNLTRLRLRPTLNLWQGARISLEYEMNALYLSNLIFFPLTSDKTNRQIVDLNWKIVNNPNFISQHFIDRLYFRQQFDFGNIVVGRQRISWGTGRIWNPTDLFNPINPANFGKIEKDGADAISAVFNLASFTDLSLVFNPNEKIKNSNSAFRFRTNYSEYDLSVIGGYFDNRIIIGGDFAGNFFDAGLRGEGIVSADKNNFKNNFCKYILGIDYQFTSRLYGLIEYQYNGEGSLNKNSYNLPRLIKGEILNLSKNYIFINATYLIHPLVNVGLSFNSNLNDGSGFFGTLVTYSSGDNSSISLGVQYFYGNDFDEYWYYPKSVYLKVDFYF
jgi:hypothetical protein